MTSPRDLDALLERYLGLESLEVIEELLECCGASIDTRALPILRRRLGEEAARAPGLSARGYLRMHEKSAQLMASLTALMTALEE
jgi:hypothetical protein